MPKSSSLVGKNKKVNPWWDDDGDGIGYEKGEVSGKFKRKKNSVKESLSNWRQDLFEIVDEIESKEKAQIKENPKIKNKVIVNPNLPEEYITETGIILFNINEVHDLFYNLNDHEISYLNSHFIEKVVEETFYELLDEGYELTEIENSLIESINSYEIVLNEAKVTLGHDTKIKSDRLGKVKSAVKTVGKALARGAGYAAGAAVRGAKALGREVASNYQKGRRKSVSGSSRVTGSRTYGQSDDSDTETTTGKKTGVLSRIGSSLKSGLKAAVRGTGRAIGTAVRGARAAKREFGSGYQRGVQGSSDKGKTVTPDTKAHPKSPGSRSVREPQRPPSVEDKRSVEFAGKPTKSQEPKKTSDGKISDPWEGSYKKPKSTKKTTSVARSGTSKRGVELRRKADEVLASLRNESYDLNEDDINMSDPQIATLTNQIEKLQSRRAQLAVRVSKQNQKLKKESFEILEREMTADEKAKEKRLKAKYDASDMKQNMIDQYGKEKGTEIYFAKIRKMAMSEENDYPELRSRTITDPSSSDGDDKRRSATSRLLALRKNLGYEGKPKKKKKKKKLNPVAESFRNEIGELGEAKKKPLSLIDLDANAMKPKKKGVEAEIEVKKDNKTVRSLNPQQFNTDKKGDNEKYDFNQFRSAKVFKKTLKGNKKVRNLHRGGESAGLTARGGMDKNREVVKHVKDSGFSKKHGVNFKGVHFTGDVPGKNTDDKKMKVIKNIIKSKKPKSIKFSDDHAKNLNAPERFNKEEGKDKTKNRGSSTPKIKTYLTRDDGRPIRYGSGGGGVRNPAAVNKPSSPQETQRRRQKARRGMRREDYEIENI